MAAQADSNRLYTITELSDELGVTPRAIRFYEAQAACSRRSASARTASTPTATARA